MARIPGSEELGGAPALGALRARGVRVPNIPTGGLEKLAQAGVAVTEKLQAAEARMNNRRNSVERIRQDREFKAFGTETFERFSSEQDFSSPEAATAFGAVLQQKADELVSTHLGGEESQLRLQARFEKTQSAFADKAAVAGVRATDALIEQAARETINELTARARLTPGDAPALVEQGRRELLAERDSYRPGQEIAFDRVLNAQVYGAAVDGLMARGEFDEAEAMLGDPIVQRALGEKAQRQMFDRLAAVKRERAKQATAPVKGIPRDVFNQLTPEQQTEVVGATPDATTIKGIPESIFNTLSDDDQRRVLGLGKTGTVKGIPRDIFDTFDEETQKRILGAEPDQTTIKGVPEDVFNALSDEEQKRVLGAEPEPSGAEKGKAKLAEAEAILGREPTEGERQRAAGVAERAPVISITQEGETAMAKELGKRDAERIDKLENDAQQAFRTLAEVERMSAAVESGRFTTGVFSDARVFLARLADFVGASEDTRELLGDAATADTLDAAANRLGVEAAQKLGRITNMSLQFVRDSLPNLTRTPEGNRILMEVMRRTSEREIQLASLAEDFLQRYNTLRPKDERTYFQAVRDLEQEDPVITPELRQRIVEGSRQPAKSFKDLFGGGPKELSTQAEIDALKSGTEFIWKPTGTPMRKD